MTLLSIELYIILAVVLTVYYIIPKSGQWVLLMLTGFAFFILLGTPHTIIYLLVSIASVYAASRYISRAGSGKRGQKTALIAAIVINIGILAVLKYSDISTPATQLAASMGISFYTFQIIGYLCDVYWGTAPVQKNPFKLALFTGYFPLLTSGPICRYTELADMLYAGHAFDYKNIKFGAQRILWGVAKKLIVAERIAPFVNTVYSSPDIYAQYAWAGALAFVIQLYADFSGSIDIIMGISECFGIALPENFKAPFFSRSVQEFWQRWHITLGAWCRDYIMFPLLRSRLWTKMGRSLKDAAKGSAGKKATKMIPTYLGMLVLWVCIGIWHGGAVKFIIQGLWFWLVIVSGQLSAPLFAGIRAQINTRGRNAAWHIFQSVRTYVIFAVGMIFFRADNLGSAFIMLKNALMSFNLNSAEIPLPELMGGPGNLLVVTAGILLMLIADIFSYRDVSLREWVGRRNVSVRWVLYYALIFGIILWGMYGGGYNPAEFIYRGF